MNNDRDVAKLILVRHGHTKRNRGYGTPTDRIRAWDDVPLDTEGRREAKLLGERLKDEPVRAVVCSDLSRSRATASAIAAPHHIRPMATRGLRPWGLGTLTGQTSASAHPYLVHYAQEVPGTKVPDGESFDEFKHRVLECLLRILSQVKRTGRTVLAVSHYRDIKLVQGWLAGGQNGKIDMGAFFTDDIEPGAILELTPDGEKWQGKLISKGIK